MKTPETCPFCGLRVLGYRAVDGHVVFEPCGHAEPVHHEGELTVWLDGVRAALSN